MYENERRQALADFLRKRRARLSPAEVGLPPGSRRRTPGLRREEVAQLADIGTSWYVWLEQGRDVHPSSHVLESIAQALRLTPNERRHLFQLAGQPLPLHELPVEESVNPALRRMLDDLNPTPAYAMGRRLDFLAWNQIADRLFSVSESEGPYGRNQLWQIFTSPKFRSYSHWERIARGMLAEFRAISASYPNDAYFGQLIEDLKQVSPEFCRWWPLHDARPTLDCYKTFTHQEVGLLEFDQITLQDFNQRDIRIMVYSPRAGTREKLQHLLDGYLARTGL